MKSIKPSVILPFLIVLAFSACTNRPKTTVRDDFAEFYNAAHVVGSFVLYDQKNDAYITYNPEQLNRMFTPASTFKICNSLIALETGVIADENAVLKWDSVPKSNPEWNCDQDMKYAIRKSTVWFYQELARRVGAKRMKSWLDTLQYGNADTAGGVDKFWLSGNLRINPEQQINFLRGLHDEALPISKRSMDIVKKIMIVEDTLGYVMRAKSGWGFQDKTEIGWYVGYLETNDNVYYFVNCIQAPEFVANDMAKLFSAGRKEIVFDILKRLKLR